jgi:hypothetical protein
MEYILIHTPRGIMTPEMLGPQLEMSKRFAAKPDDFVPGGKLITSYVARNKSLIVCIWDAPNAEALCPFVEQLELVGWDTDIMLAETFVAHVARAEKAFEAMKK